MKAREPCYGLTPIKRVSALRSSGTLEVLFFLLTFYMEKDYS